MNEPSIMKIRYSIEPRDVICVEGYEFLSYAKNIGKNLSNKHGQKLLDNATGCNENCFKKSKSKNSRSDW